MICNTVHATDMAMRVRRQLDDKETAMSLRRLLRKLDPHADSLLQDRISKCPEGVSEVSLRDKICGKGKTKLDPQVDIVFLVENCCIIRGYVDRVIAHADKRGLPSLPTWEELNRSVKTLEYQELFWGSVGQTLKVLHSLKRSFSDSPWAYLTNELMNSLP